MSDILAEVREAADRDRRAREARIDVERLARAIFVVDDGGEYVSMVDARDFAKQVAREYEREDPI